jgi:hypothetical protein
MLEKDLGGHRGELIGFIYEATKFYSYDEMTLRSTAHPSVADNPRRAGSRTRVHA